MTDQPLIDRERELSRLGELLRLAAAGSGRTVILRGQAGIGKTRLLGALRERAGAAGTTVLAARGGELERDFPFGCVRQLFEPLLRAGRGLALAGDARLAEPVFRSPGEDGAAPDAGFGTLHGLYWLTADVAEAAPLLITLDDAHWADPATLRFLAFLSPRLDGVPALVAVATRPSEPGAEGGLLSALTEDPAAETLDLEPFDEAAVRELMRARLGEQASERLASLGRVATGGNPFLLEELLREIGREGDGRPAAERIEAIGPERVARAVERRLERLGPAAPRLARAVAVLGDGASLATAGALAEVGPEAAASLADQLVEAEILEPSRPLRFVHPIVRNAVYRRMLPAERDRWHRRAATLLGRAGAAEEVVALHLLATEPGGRAEVVESLRRAAESAGLRGAPDVAVHMLERALAEPPVERLRPALLSQLGRSAAPLGDPRALAWLREAMESGDGARPSLEAAMALGMALVFVGGDDEVMAVCERVREATGRRGELGEETARWLVSLGQISPATRPAALELARENLAAALAGAERGPRRSASAAFESALAGGSAAETAALAERAVVGGLLEACGPDSLEPVLCACSLVVAERFEAAEQLLSRGEEIVHAEGDPRGAAGAIAFRSWGRLRQGRIAEVLADAELYPRFPQPSIADLVMAAVYVQALLDAGRPEQAAAVAAPVEALPLNRRLTIHQRFADAVAALRLAQGDQLGALAATEGAAAWEREIGLGAGTWSPWRSQAALAHAARGEAGTAASLAAEQVRLAREFNAPGMLGCALRAQGLVHGGGDGVELLREAEAALAGSGMRLEHARALVDLGAALRRSGNPVEAREPLGTGQELAGRLGAGGLAARALDELVAAGARPRRARRSDLDSLTPSERRVAKMAAAGMRNKEIAQELFVTVKTVETHLRHAYRKLAIGSRAQLPSALAGC